MRLNDVEGWHSFTYSQLYPAVLGSMLYEMLKLPSPWGAPETIGLSLTIFLVVDYLHLYRDLETPRVGRALETILDAAFAVSLGISFWKTQGSQFDGPGSARWLFVALTLLIPYNIPEKRRKPVKLLVLGGMLLSAEIMWRLASGGMSRASVAMACAAIPVIYAAYVFTRKTPARSTVCAVP